MKFSGDISIIIVNYFTAELCEHAINSIVKQDIIANRDITSKIIVVDNSNNQSEEEKLLNLKKTFPDSLEVILPKKNLGYSKACNLAYRFSSSEYILLLNPDAFLLRHALRELYTFLSKSPRAGAVIPKIFFDKTTCVAMPPMPDVSLSSLLMKSFLGRIYCKMRTKSYLKNAVQFWNSQRPIQQRMLSGAIVLLRRDAIEDCGGLFDERFFLYFEDTDLFFRLRKRGWQLYMIPTSLAVHRYDQSPSKYKAKYFKNSQDLFFRKNFPYWPGKKTFFSYLKGEPYPFFLKEDDDKIFCLEVPQKNLVKSCYFIFSPNKDLIPCAGIKVQKNFFSFPIEAWKYLKTGQKYYYDFIHEG